MAFSNSPELNTYKTIPVKVDGASLYRSGDLTSERDINIINMFYDRISQENKERNVRLKKRPGIATTAYSLSKTVNTSVVRGSFYDVDQNAFYWAVNNKLYAIKPDSGISVRTVATLATSSGLVGFCSFLKADNTRFVIATDGTDVWVDNYVALSCTKVTDPDLPTPHEPSPLYLNGYLFLIKKNTGDIYNSDNDDPTAWTASEFIQAEISSDHALRLVKAKNYIVCLGYNSIEYFWDAGNASGSPLSRNDSPFSSVGYVTGLQTIRDTTYFVGQDDEQNIAVFSINSFKVERVSNSVVDRTLQTYSSTANAKGQINLNTTGHCISVDGHNFYVLVTPQTTWMYDIDEKFWYEWKGSDGTGLKVEAVWGMYNGSCYIALQNQSNISVMNPSLFQDFGVNFTCQYTTEPVDAGTFNWKVLHRLLLDTSTTNATGISNVVVNWSDDDWATGTASGTRNINIFSPSPYINKLGRFRTRTFRLKYTDNYPFFIYGMSLDINVMGI
jgi:hypothetical protein